MKITNLDYSSKIVCKWFVKHKEVTKHHGDNQYIKFKIHKHPVEDSRGDVRYLKNRQDTVMVLQDICTEKELYIIIDLPMFTEK